MTLSELTLRRPVLAVVLSISFVVLGIVSLRSIGIREYPAVDPPIVTVTTSYAGAAPEVIDATVTDPLEEVINGVQGIRSISSTSREGQSIITIEFELEIDLAEAANDVRDKVAQAQRALPADIDPPVVEKADANASPIMYVTLASDTRDILDVTQTADSIIKSRVETIPGVASVRIFGEQRYSMRLVLDPARMTGHEVTTDEVASAVAMNSVDLPAGRIQGVTTEVGIRADSRLRTPEEFEAMVIRTGGARPIRLGDVGHAMLAPQDDRTGFFELGRQQVGIAVIPQPNSNAIAIADEFARRLPGIERVLPSEYEMIVGYDFTVFVRRSIDEVQETLIIAFLLVSLVIFGFLRDWRTTLVPVVAIPVSIISSFFVAWVFGFTVNILTLVALVLAIGLVCDDAIVVLENIYSKIEAGMAPLEAALHGSREVYLAVVATTVALVAVFLPVAFLDGVTGRLFREFGILIASSVAISSVVALSLSPVICRYVLTSRTEKLVPAGDGTLLRESDACLRVYAPWFHARPMGVDCALGSGWSRGCLFISTTPEGACSAGGSFEYSSGRSRPRGVDLRLHRAGHDRPRPTPQTRSARDQSHLFDRWSPRGIAEYGGRAGVSRGTGRARASAGRGISRRRADRR